MWLHILINTTTKNLNGHYALTQQSYSPPNYNTSGFGKDKPKVGCLQKGEWKIEINEE